MAYLTNDEDRRPQGGPGAPDNTVELQTLLTMIYKLP